MNTAPKYLTEFHWPKVQTTVMVKITFQLTGVATCAINTSPILSVNLLNTAATNCSMKNELYVENCRLSFDTFFNDLFDLYPDSFRLQYLPSAIPINQFDTECADLKSGYLIESNIVVVNKCCRIWRCCKKPALRFLVFVGCVSMFKTSACWKLSDEFGCTCLPNQPLIDWRFQHRFWLTYVSIWIHLSISYFYIYNSWLCSPSER